ncbi:MAG: Ig-like domain-containing protein [Rubrivivax sp.]|nr:Ig-like domain-containing protein [Rubrivivax sp.]
MQTTPSNSRPAGAFARFGAASARWLAVAATVTAGLASLVGSGGGGGGSSPATLSVVGTSPTNGATNVAVTTTVSATFSENLAANPTFTLTDGCSTVAGAVSRNGSTASFTPAAPLTPSATYTATISGGSGASGGTQSGSSTWSFTTAADPNAPVGPATISGTVDFQSVPNDTSSNGGRLLYGSTTNRPVRGATVQVVAAGSGSVLASGTTSATGTYSLTIPTVQPVILRVRAELLKVGGVGGSWDFTVRDNTQGDALYVLESAACNLVAGMNTRNLRALSGQVGASTTYTAPRVAGPFAILDVVYEAKEKLLTASANAAFPPLQLMWSVNNRPASGGTGLAGGFIGTSFYRFDSSQPASSQHRIYILGFADTDTDEYDRPVVAHEFGHYFQSAFSRDDSIGGPHSGGDQLDMRVAFSEGWGNAWSGMALATQYYTDSVGAGQQSGFRLDLAASPASNRGWYSEASVQYLMFQWHANANIGFTPIFNVLAAMPQSLLTDGAVSSIHSFAHRLKVAVPAQASAIDTLLAGQSITVADAIGSTEGNNAGIALALPVYKAHTLSPVAQQHCVTDVAGPDEPNKLAARAFIRVPLAAAGTRTVSVTSVTAGSDPDFLVIRPNGAKSVFDGSGPNESTGPLANVGAGTLLIVLHDFELIEGQNAATVNGQRCFNVTVQ